MAEPRMVSDCRSHTWWPRVKAVLNPTGKVWIKRKRSLKEKDGAQENIFKQTKECGILRKCDQ